MPGEIFLPRELIDYIIQYLVSDVDKSSLLACIRLSRQWHASALPALFHQIILRSDGRTHDTFTKFGRRAPPANKAHLVKTLIVFCQQPIGLRSNSINTYELCLILSKFPAVHSLSIVEANLVWSSRQLRGWSKRPIVDLRLSEVQCQMSDWIAGVTPLKCSLVQFLVEVFDSVHVLHLSGVQLRSAFGHNSTDYTTRIDTIVHPGAADRPKHSIPSVHKLVLPLWQSSTECTAATQLLKSVQVLDQLHSVQLDQDRLTTRAVLQVVGHTIHNLHLSINQLEIGVDDQDYGLSHCTSLSDLCICIRRQSRSYGYAVTTTLVEGDKHHSDMLVHMIKLCPRTVTSLKVELGYNKIYYLQSFDWEALDKEICGRQHLGRIMMKADGLSLLREEVRKVRQRFTGTLARFPACLVIG